MGGAFFLAPAAEDDDEQVLPVVVCRVVFVHYYSSIQWRKMKMRDVTEDDVWERLPTLRNIVPVLLPLV